MSRKYLNDKWCVRCGRKEATPYLRKNTKLFPERGKVLDIGCGNGRNSVFMLGLGYDVDSIDMVDDFGRAIVLGEDPLPDTQYDILLANYILMFLDANTRFKVMSEMNDRAKLGTILMIEMYPAKDGYKYNFEGMVDYFLGIGWKKVRKSKDRCILRRDKI